MAHIRNMERQELQNYVRVRATLSLQSWHVLGSIFAVRICCNLLHLAKALPVLL